MQIIGIVGGIASGKSLAAAQLQQLGAALIDADQIGHEVLLLDEVKQAIRARWGDAVFTPQGEVDRRSLAKIVFGESKQSAAELLHLESISHPQIKKQIEQQIAELKKQATVPAVILDAPILLKTDWRQFCDLILFVNATDEARLDRVLKRGWSAEEFAAREKRQIPVAEKRITATAVVDNSGSVEDMEHEIKIFWKSYVEK